MENQNDTIEKMISKWWNIHHVSLRNYAFKLLRNSENIDDLMQQLAIATIVRKKTFNSERHFVRWAYQKIRWLSLDHFRKRAKENLIFDKETDLEMLSTKPTQEHQQLISAIFDEIGKLPNRQKEIAERYYIQKQDTNEIALDLGINKATVRSFLRHTKALLSERLEEDYKEEI